MFTLCAVSQLLWLALAIVAVPQYCIYAATTSVAAVVSTVVHSNTSAADITVDGSGNVLYVSRVSSAVYRFPFDGVPQLLAGKPNGTGSVDGVGSFATFFDPRGITCDAAKNIVYISDSGNHRIRKLELSNNNTVTTLAGNTSGYADGVGSAALFKYPWGIVYYHHKSGGALYVADRNNSRIRKIIVATANVTIVAALNLSSGTTFCINLCITNNGTFLYVTTQYTVVRIDTTEVAAPVTLAGNAINASFADGIGSSAMFNVPRGIALNSEETALIVVDTRNYRIRWLNLSTNKVTTIAGNGSVGLFDGPGLGAMFHSPLGAKWYCNSSSHYCGVLVADESSSTVRFVAIEVAATDSQTIHLSQLSLTRAISVTPSKSVTFSLFRTGCGASTPLLSAAPSIVPSPCGERFTESNLNVSNDSVPLCVSLQAKAHNNVDPIWSAEVPTIFVNKLLLSAGRVLVAFSAAFNTTTTDGLDMHDGWQFQIHTDSVSHIDSIMMAHTANVSRVRYANLTVLLVSVTLPAGDWWNATINTKITARCDSKDEVNTSTSLVFYFPAAATADSNGATKAAEVTTAIAATAAAAFGNDVATTASLVLLSLLSCSTLAPDPGVSAYAMSVFYDHGALAMVVGNIGLAIALFLLHWSCVTFAARCVSSSRFFASRDNASSTLRFPALSMRVAEFLMPGTMFASFLCFWSADNGSGEWIAGGFGVMAVVVALVAAQGAYWRVVAPTVRFERFPHEFYLTAGSRLEATLMYPSGHWRPSAVRSRVSPLMNAFVPHREWTRTLLTMLSLMLGAVSGMATYGVGCHTGAWVAGLAHLVAGFALAVLRPYRVQWEQWMSPLLTALVGLTCMLKATGDASLSAASDSMTAAAALLQIVRTVVALWIQYREVQWSVLVVAAVPVPPTKLGAESHDDRKDGFSAMNLPHDVMEPPLDVELQERDNAVTVPQAILGDTRIGDDDLTPSHSAEMFLNAPAMDSSSRKRDAFRSHLTGASILEGFDGYFVPSSNNVA
jgi:hypothetical protein